MTVPLSALFLPPLSAAFLPISLRRDQQKLPWLDCLHERHYTQAQPVVVSSYKTSDCDRASIWTLRDAVEFAAQMSMMLILGGGIDERSRRGIDAERLRSRNRVLVLFDK